MDFQDFYKIQTLHASHPYGNVPQWTDIELVIYNRAIIHNDANILIIQSGIIISHVGFVIVVFIFIISGIIVFCVNARFHVGIADWQKGVVVFTQDSVFHTPYCIKIYCFSSIFILRLEIYSCRTYFLLRIGTNIFMFGTVWCWYLTKVLYDPLEILNTTAIYQGFVHKQHVSRWMLCIK